MDDSTGMSAYDRILEISFGGYKREKWDCEIRKHLRSHNIPVQDASMDICEETGRRIVNEVPVNPQVGKPLAQVWSHLDGQERDKVIKQLRDITNSLREIKQTDISPPPYTTDRFIMHRISNGAPFMRYRFKNNQEFVNLFQNRVRRKSHEHGAETVAILVGELAKMDQSDELVFTHGDLSPDNIYVSRDSKVVAIGGWREAGFYPRYWEFAKARLTYSRDEDFGGVVQKVLQPYWIEYSIIWQAHRLLLEPKTVMVALPTLP